MSSVSSAQTTLPCSSSSIDSTQPSSSGPSYSSSIDSITPAEQEAVFKELAFGFSNSPAKKFMSPFPLIYSIQLGAATLFNLCERENPLFTRYLKVDLMTLSKMLCKAIYAFKVKRDPKPIIDLLKRCKTTIDLIRKDNVILQLISDEFESYIKAFETNRLDLFQMTALEHIGEDYAFYSKEERYRFAVKTYQAVYRAFELSAAMIGKIRSASCFEGSGSVIIGQISRAFRQNQISLQRDPRLKKNQKIELCRFYINLIKNHENELDKFSFLLKNVFFGSVFQSYLSVMSNGQVDQICGTASGGLTEIEEANLYYVAKHREIYEDFLPRIQENFSALLSVTEDGESSAILLENFLLYMRLGDLDQLSQKLDARGRRSVESVIKGEILDFNRQVQLEPLKSAVRDFHLNNPEFASIQEHFGSLKETFQEQGRMVFTVVEDALRFAGLHTGDLFLYPIPTRLPASAPVSRSVSRRAIKGEKGIAPSQSRSDSLGLEASSSPVLVSSSSEPSSSRQITVPRPNESLNALHQQIALDFESLKVGCKGFGTADALENAQGHLEDTFSVIHRALQKPIALMTRKEVQAFVVDCVSHMALATEQLISALDRESNGVKNQAELKDRLTHDLYCGLLKCKFPGGPIPISLSQWIRDASRGEILARDLSQCKLERPGVHKLLAKVWLFARGNDAFDEKQIMGDALAFCQKGMEACSELQRQIQLAKPAAPPPKTKGKARGGANKQNSIVSAPKIKIAPIFNALETAILSERGIDDSVLDQLGVSSSSTQERVGRPESLQSVWASIDRHVSEFESLLGAEFDNLRQNLLANLEVEVRQMGGQLHPAHAHLQVGKFLLYHQMILEEILNLLLSSEGTERLEIDSTDHNLMKKIVALGINPEVFSPEEQVFLNNGKEVRHAVRYSASYAACHSKQKRAPKLMEEAHAAITNSRISRMAEIFTFDPTFISGDRTLAANMNKARHVVMQNVQLLNTILEKTILEFERIQNSRKELSAIDS